MKIFIQRNMLIMPYMGKLMIYKRLLPPVKGRNMKRQIVKYLNGHPSKYY